MTNIWGFLIQTLSVTLIAAMLLVIKTLLNDKLSPRWQYGMWSILAIRILLPVSIQKSLLLPISVWVETLKAFVEKQLVSNYSNVYVPARMKHIAPIVEGKPESITDWLFVIYVIGILISLVWYLISYLRLRLLLSKGSEPAVELQKKINLVCEKYGLKACKSVVIKGLPSAFVCGGIKPILALPLKKDIDEKVLLHELLHLKYHDELQSLAWCVIRSLHWCNPFLQYVFNRIENDMESLCDQRVLERLQGEERREYGVILLEMANEKYARVPGTSSISNGGKNISRRIAAIVRFKKYPKGMALVSVCVIIVLMLPALRGTAYAYKTSAYEPREMELLNYSMAMVRVNRCTTVAGALDTYAKGLLYKNGFYIASASPIEKHEAIERAIAENTRTHMYWYDAGKEFETVITYNGYNVWNLEEVEENVFKAYLVFNVYNEESQAESLIVPVTVRYEDAWVVEERGERKISPFDLMNAFYPSVGIDGLKQYTAKGDAGTVTVTLRSAHYVDNILENSFSMFGTTMDQAIKLDAEFSQIRLYDSVVYTCDEENGPNTSFGVLYQGVESSDEDPKFTVETVSDAISGGNSDGESWASQRVSDGNQLRTTGWKEINQDEIKHWADSLPQAYKLRIFWDDNKVEDLTAEEAEGDILDNSYINTESKNMYSVYIDSASMIDLVNRKATVGVKDEDELLKSEIDDLIEEVTFAEYAQKEQLLQQLERAGVFRCEISSYSNIPSAFSKNVVVFRPELYYNANDGSWIVVSAGYCLEDFRNQIVTGNVGERDTWGIEFANTEGPYACGSFVMNSVASLADAENHKRKETYNRYKMSEAGGQEFELQDYTYKEIPVVGETKYVGARWYGACTFAPGFEKCSGDLIAYYNHTN